MTDLDRDDAAETVVRLTEAAAAHGAELQYYAEDGHRTKTDEESDSNSPIADKFYEEAGTVGIAQMTIVLLNEFNRIYDLFPLIWETNEIVVAVKDPLSYPRIVYSCASPH